MNKINTNKPFAEGMANAGPNGYTYTGESQCQDWNSHYVACQTALDGTSCSIKATTIDECAAECNKRDSCGEMYFKDGVCYLADGKCVPKTNPTNPQPHYKKGSAPVATPSGFKYVSSGQPVDNISQEECKTFTDKLDGYSFSVINESGNPKGCILQDGTPPGSKGVYYNTGGTADCGAFNGVSKCVVKDTFSVPDTSSGKIKLDIKGRWNSDISKEFDNKPGTYTVDESPEYGTTSDCGARDTCVVEVNDKSQARIRMLDRCKSVQANHPFSDYIGAGGTIEKDGCSITKFTSIPGAPASAASAGMNIIPATSMNTTSSTKETSSVDPTTGAKVTEKCVTVTELSTAAKWVDHLFGTLSNTKCADKEKVMAAKTASKTDFISGIIKGYQNDKDGSNQYYMQAIDKAKPMLDAAFDVKVHSAATPNSQHPLLQGGEGEGEGEHLQNNVTDTMMDGATNGLNQNGSVPDVTTLEDELKQTPAYQQAVNQISGNNNNANYQMANGNLVQPPTGDCPNGCRAPQYDNDKCTNLELGGKAYRSCPWIGDGSINDSMCKDCGSILLPKNDHGYARTRPGLYNKNTINKLLAGTTFNKEPEKSNVNYTNIGLEFMTELSRARNFNLPYISQQNYEKIGRIVSKYQLDVNTGNTNKKDLTDIINGVLNSGTIPTSLNSVSDNLTGQIQSNTDGFSLQTVTDKPATSTDTGRSEKIIKGLLGKTDYYESSSIGLQEKQNDNRLGGSKTLYSGYTTKYRPQDPRKGVKPYDSIWELFKQ